jgi:hypothetical protein
MIRVETENSVYLFDTHENQYLRMPNAERDRTDWEKQEQERSEWLYDHRWMPLHSVRLVPILGLDEAMHYRLNIRYEGATYGVFTSEITEMTLANAKELHHIYAASNDED